MQRWEKDHALPVQRHVNAKQGSVFGYREELDAWWNDRRGELESQSVQPRRTILGRLARTDVAWTIAAGATIVAVALAMVNRTTPVPVSMVGLSVVLGTDVFLDTSPGGSMLALSPDGSQLAFVGRSAGRVRLFLRRLDRFESRVLPGTDNAISPFFSPDGHWVGFFAIDGIKRIAIEGDAPPEMVSRVPEPEGGAVWQPDDTIIFATGTRGLMRVSARGGMPQPLTDVDVQHHEYMHRDPAVLPGGRTVLYTVWSPDKSGAHFRIDAQSLESGERRTILADGRLLGYVPGAGLIFARAGRVMATRFDPQRLETTGDPVAAMEAAYDMP